ncbi:MAG: ATP-binding cassette domain-containing protein [Defluviitaleaceae bacterium]|nr:ATP-binding cassette domain-containing protein [Defluviitaleaceae bacterium]
MAIQITNIHKNFSENVIFAGFSLDIEDGAKLAIMGPSGKGKTTLINMLCGFTQPDTGNIIKRDGLQISMVFQEDRLLPYKSGLANVLFPLKRAKNHAQVAIDLMAQAGLGQDIHKKTAQYSGGMKRRLALCRALMVDFDLLILDEPFKGLDAALKPQIMELVKTRTQNKTLVLVTHDPAEADFFGATTINI